MARKGIPMNKMSHFDDLMGGRDESWKDVGEPWVVVHAVEGDAVEGEQEYDTYDEAWQRATELAQERDPGCATEKEFNVAPKSSVVPGNAGSRFPEGFRMKLKDFFINEATDPNSKYDNWPDERKKASKYDTDSMASDPGAQLKRDKKIGMKEGDDGSGVVFDFDVSGEDISNVQFVKTIVKNNGGEVVDFNPNGPGGGNPNFTVAAPNKAAGREILSQVYDMSWEEVEQSFGDHGLGGVDEARNAGQFSGGNFTKDAAKRSADFKKRWPDSTPKDDDEGEHSPSDDEEAARWKSGMDESDEDVLFRQRPSKFDGGGNDPGHEDPDGNVCPDCKGGNWSSDGTGPCPTCKGMGTADGSNPMEGGYDQWLEELEELLLANGPTNEQFEGYIEEMGEDAFNSGVSPQDFIDQFDQYTQGFEDTRNEKQRLSKSMPEAFDKEFENIEQWEQEVWDYAQHRYNLPAAKLNALSQEMDDAFANDVPPDQFVDELMGVMGEAGQVEEGFGDDQAGDNIVSFNRYLEDVWAYAQQRYNVPAEKLNAWEPRIRRAYQKDTPDPQDLVDDIMRGRVHEASGENAASKRYKKGPMEKDRQDKHKASGEPQVNDPGFAGKDPDDEMFFGSKQDDDYVGTMLDPAAGEEFAGKKVDDFGGPEDSTEDPGFGSDVGPGDTDSVLGTSGGWHHEEPGSDVMFPEYEPKAQERGSHWWDNKEPEFHPPKNPAERHSDIEKAPSFPDDDPQMADYLRKGGKLGY